MSLSSNAMERDVYSVPITGFQTIWQLFLPIPFLSSLQKVFDTYKTFVNTAIQKLLSSSMFPAEVSWSKQY